MLRPVFLTVVGIAMSVGPLHAQQAKTAEEKAVWALIEASGTVHPKVTDDIVFVSGHYPRPIIGRQKVVARDTATDSAGEAPVERPLLKMRPQKVAVSRSGDMATGLPCSTWNLTAPIVRARPST